MSEDLLVDSSANILFSISGVVTSVVCNDISVQRGNLINITDTLRPSGYVSFKNGNGRIDLLKNLNKSNNDVKLSPKPVLFFNGISDLGDAEESHVLHESLQNISQPVDINVLSNPLEHKQTEISSNRTERQITPSLHAQESDIIASETNSLHFASHPQNSRISFPRQMQNTGTLNNGATSFSKFDQNFNFGRDTSSSSQNNGISTSSAHNSRISSNGNINAPNNDFITAFTSLGGETI